MSYCPRKAYYVPNVERAPMNYGAKPKTKSTVQFPAIKTWETPDVTAKAQALKVHEEAAELVEAIKTGDDDAALYEAADVLQALGNLFAVKKWTAEDIASAYKRVQARNHERGRC